MILHNNEPITAAAVGTLALVTRGPAETRTLGAIVGELLRPGDIIALHGELGSGKTQFVKGLARGLGVREAIHSPTFILANEHRSGRLPLFHIDAYRVTGVREAAGFGLEEYLDDAGVTAIEWAERIEAALPPEHLKVRFTHLSDNEREVSMEGRGGRYVELLRELRARLDSRADQNEQRV